LIERIDASREKVTSFGLLFGGLALAVAAYVTIRGGASWPWLGAALLLILAGTLAYPVLRPVYIGWMTFAYALGWINTRILLGVFFYLVLTPIGIFLRLAGKDLLDRRIDRRASSYWIRRERIPFHRSRSEHLF
jgi:hypothetical protein